MHRDFRSCSRRMQAVQSPIIPDIAVLIEQNPGTISLGQGVVFYGPPDSIFKGLDQTMTQYENQLYGPVAGIADLVDVIEKKLLQDNQIELKDNYSILVTAGANMGFLNALFAITEPGEEVILLTPFYFNHEMAIEMLGCKVKPVATDANYQPCIEKIKHAISKKTRAIVTVSPNNPTGVVYPKEVLTEINQLCFEHGIYHISDEAYEYFTYNGHEHFSPASLNEAKKHTISLYSLSKSYGFASWRIAYMVVPEHLFKAVQKAQDTNLICPTIISQFAATKALSNGAEYCLNKLPILNENRLFCLEKLSEINHLCSVPESGGGFYIFLKLNTELDSFTVAKQLIEEYKVAVIPGSTFGMESGCYIRLSYGALDLETLEQAMERLLEGLGHILS